MENPLDTTTSAGESLAQQIAGLQRQIAALERARTVPATISSTTLAGLKAQLPASAPNNTIVIGRLGGGTERVYLYVYEATAGAWYRSGTFTAA